MEKIMNLRGNREIKSIKAQEHIGIKPEVTFEIEFDNKEKLIIDLTILGNVTQRVAKELDEMERKLNEKLSLGLMASFMAMGIDKKDLKDIFKEIK